MQSREHIVTIPIGAGSPTPDLTLQNLANWYDPKEITINQGDTVTWRNDDTEPHSITSGIGGGIVSAHTGEKGDPDGLFDSGLFGSGESWSYIFDGSGTFSYFCSLHPWMEAVVIVEPNSIPDYPVDAQGNEQEVWPVHTFSADGRYDIDLNWSPKAPVTGETVTFFADFFDAKNNARIQLVPYDFILMQNDKEVDNVYSLTQIGAGVHKYVFSESGPVTIKIANVGDYKSAVSEFTTLVYQNPNLSDSGSQEGVKRLEGGSQPASRIINSLTLVYFTYAVIFTLPAAAGMIVILYKKGKI